MGLWGSYTELSSQGVFPRRPFCLVNEGMWGGYLAIRSARDFLLHKVLASPGVLERLGALGIPSPNTMTIAVHVRQDNFLVKLRTRGNSIAHCR